MITYERALKYMLTNTPILSSEEVFIEDSVGRMLDEDVYSDIHMPPFNKSAMDGYAIISKDTINAPVKLKCIGLIQACESLEKGLKKGECVKIMTGAPIPENADGVVMVEDARADGQDVAVTKSVKKGENICFRGEDIKAGKKVVEKRRLISTSHIGLLASIGRQYIKAIKKPNVAVLNTGDEIVRAGERLGENKIYNSNGPTILALLKSDGICPVFLGIAKDNAKDLLWAIKDGLKADILLISGGVSMGDYDLIPDALNKIGAKIIFHKVNIKPGKPLLFAKKGNTIIFGIPGNPVSNFLAYLIFVKPTIQKMMGHKICSPEIHYGILRKDYNQKKGRRHYVPVKILRRDAQPYLFPSDSHGSADIMSLSKSDGFMIVEGDIEFIKKNTSVPFITWK